MLVGNTLEATLYAGNEGFGSTIRLGPEITVDFNISRGGIALLALSVALAPLPETFSAVAMPARLCHATGFRKVAECGACR